MAYTCSQLQQLWIQAGGDQAVAGLMASVAMAESSGDPNATSSAGAAGLWQILTGKTAQSYDPLTNAQQAVQLYNARGTEPWASSQNQGNGGGWGVNPLCGGGGATASSQATSAFTAAARGQSSGGGACVHSISVFNINPPGFCLDGLVGMGAALLGLITLLVAALMLTGRSATVRGVRFPYAVVPRFTSAS